MPASISRFFLFQKHIQRKRQVNPSHYAIYHLHVIEERPASEVSQTLGVNRAQNYLAKNRVSAALKKEIVRLEAEGE